MNEHTVNSYHKYLCKASRLLNTDIVENCHSAFLYRVGQKMGAP